MKENILQKVKDSIGVLSPSEAMVARCVALAPETIAAKSIGALAQEAGVSEPTVMRFCRSVGCKGYQGFKDVLAVALVGDVMGLASGIQPDDPTEIMIGKVGHYSSEAIKTLIDSIDVEVVEQSIDCLSRAKRIDIYGSGGSGIVALDIQYKFFRMKLPAIAYVDSQLQLMAAASLDAKSVVIAVSRSGESRNILEATRRAKEQGAKVISITCWYSSLAQLSDLVFATPDVDDERNFLSMVSNRCQLTIVDLLAMGLAMNKGSVSWDNMKKKDSHVESWKVCRG